MTARRKRKDQGRRAVKAVLVTEPPWSCQPREEAVTRAPALLAAVADALNACERGGLLVKLAHGAVMTPAGYVLPVGTDLMGSRYEARTRTLTEFRVKPSQDGDED